MSDPAQHAEWLQYASQAASRMILEDICLLAADFHRETDLDIQSEVELRCDFRFHVEHEYDASAGRLVALVHHGSRGRFAEDDSDDGKELFQAEGVYRATYRLDAGDPLPDYVIEAFAKLNGVFNTWPYWREFLQSITTRMSMPPVTLPLITAQKILGILAEHERKKSVAKSADAPEEAAAG